MLLHRRKRPTACGKRLAWLQAPAQHDSTKRLQQQHDSGLEVMYCGDNASSNSAEPAEDPEGHLVQEPLPYIMDTQSRHDQRVPSIMDPGGSLDQQRAPSIMDPGGSLDQQRVPSIMDPGGSLDQKPVSFIMDLDAPYEWNFSDTVAKRRQLDVEAMSLSCSKPTACNKIFSLLCKSVPYSQQPQTLETLDSDQLKHKTCTQNRSERRKPGRPPKPKVDREHKVSKKIPKIWEFISGLLQDPATSPSVVEWEDEENGIFRFVDPQKAGRLWGKVKNNPFMNYEKMSRAMRYHYTTEALEMVKSKRLVYKFGIKAKR